MENSTIDMVKNSNHIGIVNACLRLNMITDYKVIKLVQAAFDSNIMGTSSMIAQLKYFEKNQINFNLLSALKIPGITTDVSGLRKSYIEKYGINPFFFNTWL